MDTRVKKYDNEKVNSRTKRNEALYREINKNDLDNFEVKSNSTVLGQNQTEIDVEKIKKILDTKYNEVPQRKSIRIEDNEDVNEIEKEQTKEYDINKVLAKAKENKSDTPEEERLKQIKNTEYDILKSLELNKENENKNSKKKKDNLEDLINTIAINENMQKNIDLDLLSDLKGSDNTEVLEGLKEEIDDKKDNENEDTTIISSDNDETMDDSFYTKSNIIAKKDLDDDTDFSKEFNNNNTFLKIVIALIILIFLGGIGILIKILFLS